MKKSPSQGGATVPALQNLALGYGMTASSVKNSQMSASGLIWGVLDDAYLASLTVDEIDTVQTSRGQREIGVNYATSIQNNSGEVVTKGHILPSAPKLRGRSQAEPLIRRQAPGLAGITAAELMDTHTHLAPYLAPEDGDNQAEEEAGVYLLEPAGHQRHNRPRQPSPEATRQPAAARRHTLLSARRHTPQIRPQPQSRGRRRPPPLRP